jgi:hypothetical protein
MQGTRAIDLVTIDSAGSFNDFARRYQIFVSTDGSTWTGPVASGAGYLDLIVAAFAPQNARYIKIVQTGSSSAWWSVAEVYVSS